MMSSEHLKFGGAVIDEVIEHLNYRFIAGLFF